MFNSENFIFRHTPLGDALIRAGYAKGSMVREAKVTGVLRQRNDPDNSLPSVTIDFEFKQAGGKK